MFGGAGKVGRTIAAALAQDGLQVDATTRSALSTGCAAAQVPRLGIRATTIRTAGCGAVIDIMASPTTGTGSLAAFCRYTGRHLFDAGEDLALARRTT
jgi:predicted dinucleotide-binding enzyme